MRGRNVFTAILPTGLGQEPGMMFIALDKLQNQGSSHGDHGCAGRSIGASFHAVKRVAIGVGSLLCDLQATLPVEQCGLCSDRAAKRALTV